MSIGEISSTGKKTSPSGGGCKIIKIEYTTNINNYVLIRSDNLINDVNSLKTYVASKNDYVIGSLSCCGLIYNTGAGYNIPVYLYVDNNVLKLKYVCGTSGAAWTNKDEILENHTLTFTDVT